MTAQVHDKLILNGKSCTIAGAPLIPENIDELEIAPEKEWIKFSNCWRMYVATWEIKEDKFYLKSVSGYHRKKTKKPIFADWYTGVLKVPYGELLKLIYRGFSSIFEFELQIIIEKGQVITYNNFDNRPKYKNADSKRWEGKWRLDFGDDD